MDFDNSLDKIIPDVLEFVSFGGTALQIPSGTTAERPTTPDVGATRLNTETGKVEIYNGSWTNIDSGGGSSGMTFTTVKTGNYTAAVDEIVRINSSAAGFTVTLPSAPADGAKVGIFDIVNMCNINNVLVNPTSGTIEGSATGLIVDVKGTYIVLAYNSSTSNWKIMDLTILLS